MMIDDSGRPYMLDELDDWLYRRPSMSPQQSMVAAAYKQQQLTGRKDADVAFVIMGKWPDGGHKRLAGRKGPLGRCMAEYEDSVMCLFKADEVIRFCGPLLPVLTIKPLTPEEVEQAQAAIAEPTIEP